VEQYTSSRWGFGTTGSGFLDLDGPFEIRSIFVHEHGHALNFSQTSGPNPRQRFIPRPNGYLFTPTAVMDLFSLGGEKRSLFPIEPASLRQLYSRVNGPDDQVNRPVNRRIYYWPTRFVWASCFGAAGRSTEPPIA